MSAMRMRRLVGRMRAGWVIAVALCLLLPISAGADDGATPLMEWQRLYNSLALEAGLAVNALADDPDPLAFMEAEQRLTDLADGLGGVVPDDCYQGVHEYARLAAQSLLVGVRIARDGLQSGLRDGEDLDLYRLSLRDLAASANHQLRFPGGQNLAWVARSCAG